jgi:hypothetical protein
MIPIRYVSDALGAETNWSSETNTCTIEQDGISLTIVVGEPLPNELGVSVIVDERLFVPVRYVAEQLRATVGWLPETKTITIL